MNFEVLKVQKMLNHGLDSADAAMRKDETPEQFIERGADISDFQEHCHATITAIKNQQPEVREMSGL